MGRECDSCGRTDRATRSSHRYCSWTCRKRASRGALRSVATGGAVAPGSSSVATAVQAELLRDGQASAGSVVDELRRKRAERAARV